MSDKTIVIIVALICLAFSSIIWNASKVGIARVNKTCIGSEMQYFKMEKCIKYQGDPDHRVCQTDEMRIYFNMSGNDNLTQTEIDSLAGEL